ncbi:MAG: Diacylglycerol kinase [Candidatus Nomurabacteria bacterium GW2011_GWB1_40_7]|uniref:Diacylglycerol kinase n=1 Tax=Candidatus Nomurabacteria bacterium GW2011_GWB1_40_7 TaxID=1618744 RepID=A0A0G0T7E8_9BACT|nr:MAG: Diacylglycerol kinase [Candidatus Nomurabacteria bacterium GW2011_GWB1_40_7]
MPANIDIMNSQKEQKAWREVKYSEKFSNAFRGIYVAFKVTRHAPILIFATLIVIVCGFYFKVSNLEWIVLIFAIGFVLVSEVFNTAIEIDIDLTSPEYHPYAKDTKDVAAAAVLLSVFVAIIVGLIIFLPKVF